MSYSIPTTEPEIINAGDRLQWTKSLGDYPASEGWSLTYYLRSNDAAGQINISTTASNADHAVDVAAGTTATWTPAVYWWRSFISDGTSRYPVEESAITVLPNFAALIQAYDGRTDNEVILDNLRTTLRRLSTRQLASYSAAGRSDVLRSMEEIQRMISEYEGRVANDRDAALIARGLKVSNQVLIRF